MAKKDKDKLFGERFDHPAYGMITLGRVQGSTRLHNSDIKHLNFIHLTISTAHMNRNLHRDWHHADDTIVEVWLSPVQLSEALFNMNSEGVPCTLRYYRDPDAKLVQADINSMPRFELLTQFEQETNEMLEEAMENVAEASAKLDAMMESKGAKKSDIRELKAKLDKAHQHMKSNLAFIEKSFREAMEEKVMQAKAELDGFMENKLRALGMEALQEDAKKMFSEAAGSPEKQIEGKTGKKG